MRDKLKAFVSATGAAAVVLLLLPAMTEAAPIIRLDQFDQGGTMTGDDLTGVVGDDIMFQFITYDAEGDGIIDAVVYCGVPTFQPVPTTSSNCYLNFDTNADTFVVTAPSGLFDSAGVLIPGTVGITVLDGTFNSWELVLDGTQFNATGLDTKHPLLLEFFGVDPNTAFMYNTTEIRRTSDDVVIQADITNTAIPEPGLLALFGLGLVGAARRFSRGRV